jgi:hypothetical protein
MDIALHLSIDCLHEVRGLCGANVGVAHHLPLNIDCNGT